MAETSYRSSPKLNQTTDEVAYTPISWLAVAAGVAALVFALVFILLSISSFLKKQPMIMPVLLALPLITLVLSFAAYCHVNNSEGTRTGKLFKLNLVGGSAAIGLLGGAGYIAYLGAMEFAVRKDAEIVFNEWTKHLVDISPNDPNDPGIIRALHRTLEPSSQQRVNPADVASIRNAFSEQYTQFSQSDLVRICRRHPGNVTIVPQGLVNWEREQQRARCTLNADITSPEGVHTISLEMIADIAPNGSRAWGLQNKPSYVVARRLTPYGKSVEDLENVASQLSQRFVESLGLQIVGRFADPTDQKNFRQRLYIDFIANPFPPAKPAFFLATLFRVALAGAPAAIEANSLGYEKSLVETVFAPIVIATGLAPDMRAKEERDMRTKFEAIWNGSRIARSGSLIKGSKDVFPILTHDDKSIRVSVPCEMLMPGSDQPTNATRARLTFECTDPKIVGDLMKLKNEAKPNDAKPSGALPLSTDSIPFRIVRIESDMKPGPQPQQARSEGGGGP